VPPHRSHRRLCDPEQAIGGVTADRRLQLLLIAFSFGAFFEGASGFGTPVAVSAAILIGLGFSPLAASGLSLIANTAPVAYGALGTPIAALASVPGLVVLADRPSLADHRFRRPAWSGPDLARHPCLRRLFRHAAIPDFDTSAAVRLRSPLSTVPAEILSRRFRNAHHHGFCPQQLAVA
jgi:hypothetical protein